MASFCSNSANSKQPERDQPRLQWSVGPDHTEEQLSVDWSHNPNRGQRLTRREAKRPPGAGRALTGHAKACRSDCASACMWQAQWGQPWSEYFRRRHHILHFHIISVPSRSIP